MQVNGELHARAILPVGKEPRYPLPVRTSIEEMLVFNAQYILFVSCRDKQKGQCHVIANRKSN